VSEDSLRRNLAKIDEAAGVGWLQSHLDYCTTPLLSEPFRHRRSHRLMTVPHRRETVFLSNTVSKRRAGLQPPPP
jgi:hypothetical protein